MVIAPPEVTEADLKYLLIVFDQYISAIEGEGRTPADSDIHRFCEQSYLNAWWRYDSNNFKGAGLMLRGCDAEAFGTDHSVFDKTPYTLAEFIEMLSPVLKQKVMDIYGSISDEGIPSLWDTEPTSTHLPSIAKKVARSMGVTNKQWDAMSSDEQQNTTAWAKAAGQVKYVKERIARYNDTVLRFQLRKTMHHNLGTIKYVTSDRKSPQPTRNWGERGDRRPIVLHSEADIDTFIEFVGKPHRDLYFSGSMSGQDVKMGFVDIDIHDISIDDKEVRRLVRDINKILQDRGHPTLIQFTGHGWHVWFGRAGETPLGSATEVRHYITHLFGKMQRNNRVAFDKEEAKMLNVPVIDRKAGNGRNSQIGMFFGLHYKTARTHPEFLGTGLARVPVRPDEMLSFDKFTAAHPETVMAKFHELSVMVDRFFDQVRVGEGHDADGVEEPPNCFRSEANEPTHALSKTLTEWKKKPAFVNLRWEDAQEMFFDEKRLVVTPKYDGWLTGIHYKEGGGHRVKNKTLSTSRTVRTTSGLSTLTEPVTTIMCSKGGLLFWDNHITKEFAETCKRAGLREALVVGELFEYDAFGKVRGAHAITSAINKKMETEEGFVQNEREMRSLRFAALDVWSLDNKAVDRSVPYEQRHKELDRFSGSRIKVVELHEPEGDISRWLPTMWKSITVNDAQEGLVVHHKNKRFKVKRRYTLDAVIIGVSKESKAWLDGKKAGHVFHIAVMKKTKYGPSYIHVGTVNYGPGWDREKQTELFERVVGEKRGEGPTSYTNSLGPPRIKTDDIRLSEQGIIIEDTIMLVEPTVVVEVEFDKLGNIKQTIGMYYEQDVSKPQRGRKTKSGFRFIPSLLKVRSLIGPATIIRTRDDKLPDSMDDLSHIQAEGAGGLGIGAGVVKSNPIYSHPLRELNPIQKWFARWPIVWSSGVKDVMHLLILDYNLTYQHFRGSVNPSFPAIAPVEMYRKLWGLMHRDKEYGGFVKDNTLYYGTISQAYSIAFIPTHQTEGADFVFHTHPYVRNSRGGMDFTVVSPEDIFSSLNELCEWGIEWQLVVEDYGFTWLHFSILDDSPLHPSKNVVKKEDDFRKWTARVRKALEKEFKVWNKKWELSRSLIAPEVDTTDYGAQSPYLLTEGNIHMVNETSKHFQVNYHFVPVPLYGWDLAKNKKIIIVNPGEGHGFRGMMSERATSAAGGINAAFGRPVGPGFADVEALPRRLTLRDEFKKAIDRGKLQAAQRGEGPLTDENRVYGWKVYPFPKGARVHDIVGGLPLSMHHAQAEESLAHKSVRDDDDKGRYIDMLRMDYLSDDKQSSRDAEMAAITSLTTSIKQTREPGWMAQLAQMEAETAKSGKPTDMLRKKEKEDALAKLHADMLRRNPASDNEGWNVRVTEYRKAHRDWMQQPEPRQAWSDYSLGLFPRWEVPLLEKGRMLEEAEDQYTLSEREEAIVSQHYALMGADVTTPLQGVFSSLFEDMDIMDVEGEARDVTEQ